MAENTLSFIEKIVNAIMKKRFDSENLMRVKPAVVIGCDEKSGKTSVYMLDDDSKKPYNLLNKTGEILVEGDNVKVYYTKNIAKGYIGMRVGLANVVKACGVGRSSPFDETSEYFNNYKGNGNIAGVPGKKSYATAKGQGTEATGYTAFATGQDTKAKGNNSFTTGFQTETNSYASFICGSKNKDTDGEINFMSGLENKMQNAKYSASTGRGNTITGVSNFAQGEDCQIDGKMIITEGQDHIIKGTTNSHFGGAFNKATNGGNILVYGSQNESVAASNSAIFGMQNKQTMIMQCLLSGFHNTVNYSNNMLISGQNNEINVEGSQANAIDSSAVIGMNNKMTNGGGNDCVIGLFNELTGSYYSFVSGMFNKTNGIQATSVLGMYNEISGTQFCTASGGWLKLLPGSTGVVAFGQYNNPLADYIFMVGNGTGEDSRSNAFAVTRDGVVICKSVAQLGADGTTIELHDTHLDLSAVSLEKSFTWSEESYPNSTDPNLNGKPVLVLSLVGGENVAYKFIDMSMFVYDKQDTQTSEIVLADNKFSVNVKISAEKNNALVKKEDGLYASIPNTVVSSEVGNIIQEKEDGLFAANRKIKLINHEPTSADLEGEECIIMQYDSANDIVGANTTLHKITGLFYEN